MVLFLNRWKKRFLTDLLNYRLSNNSSKTGTLSDKYTNRIPNRVTIKGLLDCLSDEELMRFITPVSGRYTDENPAAVYKDGLYFHRNKIGNGYVFYEIERGGMFSLLETPDPRKAFGAFLVRYLGVFNHLPKDYDEYSSPKPTFDE